MKTGFKFNINYFWETGYGLKLKIVKFVSNTLSSYFI